MTKAKTGRPSLKDRISKPCTELEKSFAEREINIASNEQELKTLRKQATDLPGQLEKIEIGRASCRERV